MNKDTHQHTHQHTSKHTHQHAHHDHHHHHSQGNIKVAFILNLTFTIIEIIGGFLTNSVAILSDALHDLGDSLSLGIAWWLERYAQKKPDHRFSFGYARFSILGALLNSFILFGGSILILTKAIPRIFNPEAVHPEGMFGFAILGILINGMAVLRLQHGESINEKVVSWHLLEDVFGWVVILISSIILMFFDWPIIDPLLSIGLTLFVLYNVIKNIKGILNILLEGVPEEYVIQDVEALIETVQGVKSVHHTHIWSLEGQKIFLSTHVVVDNGANNTVLVPMKQAIRHVLIQEKIEHATIEIEFEDEDCDNHSC